MPSFDIAAAHKIKNVPKLNNSITNIDTNINGYSVGLKHYYGVRLKTARPPAFPILHYWEVSHHSALVSLHHYALLNY